MLNILAHTDVGKRRANNQDTFAFKVFSNNLGYGMVCDGMGGENGGELASSIAREQIARMLESSLREDSDARLISKLLQSAISTANAMVAGKAATQENLKGMGTTLVLAIIKEQKLYLCHVGDSRAYLIRDGKLTRLTKDHTVVQMLIDKGEITEQDALTHPERHYITRAIGVSSTIDPDYNELTMQDGDLVLLCSDGLYNMLPEQQLVQACQTAKQQHSVHGLIDCANDMGGADNITAMLVFRA